MGMDSFLQLKAGMSGNAYSTLPISLSASARWQLDAEHPMQQVLTARSQAPQGTDEGRTSCVHKNCGQIFPVAITPQDISSTQIREQLAKAKFPPIYSCQSR